MEKKKMKLWKKIIIIVGVIFAIFMIHTVRNIVIIKSLSDKADSYKNASNYYVKTASSQGIIVEKFVKGEQYFMKLENVSPTGIKRLMNYCDGEKINTYIEVEDENGITKVAIPDSNGLPSNIQITNWFDYTNLSELTLMSMLAIIRSEEINGKDCYKIGYLFSSNILYSEEGKFELYIDKETGLTIKNINGTMVDENGNKLPIMIEYEYKFDCVTDEALMEPDNLEYEVQQK